MLRGHPAVSFTKLVGKTTFLPQSLTTGPFFTYSSIASNKKGYEGHTAAKQIKQPKILARGFYFREF